MNTRKIFTQLNAAADSNPISLSEAAEAPALTQAVTAAHPRFNPSLALTDLQNGIDRLSGLHGRLSHMLRELEDLVGTKSTR